MLGISCSWSWCPWLLTHESFISYVAEASASRKSHSFPGAFTVSPAWRRRAELFGDGNMCGFCGHDVKSNVSKVVLVLDLTFGNVIGVVDSSTNSVPGLWACRSHSRIGGDQIRTAGGTLTLGSRYCISVGRWQKSPASEFTGHTWNHGNQMDVKKMMCRWWTGAWFSIGTVQSLPSQVNGILTPFRQGSMRTLMWESDLLMSSHSWLNQFCGRVEYEAIALEETFQTSTV